MSDKIASLKEKFRLALTSTAKVISDDFDLINKSSENDQKKDLITQKKAEKDGREKEIYLSEKGQELSNSLFNSQKNRVLNAFKKSSPDEVLYFKNVLKRIIE